MTKTFMLYFILPVLLVGEFPTRNTKRHRGGEHFRKCSNDNAKSEIKVFKIVTV